VGPLRGNESGTFSIHRKERAKGPLSTGSEDFMANRFKVMALLLLISSCTGPPYYMPADYPPLEGIHEGDTSGHVRDVLGKPAAWENGWWRDGGVRYEQDFQVWFYAGKGRIVFDGSGHVVLTEADPHQPGYAVSQPYSGLYPAE
jgi:hypothetical protein